MMNRKHGRTTIPAGVDRVVDAPTGEVKWARDNNDLLAGLLTVECQECGGTDTEWHCTQTTRSGVADGKLRLNEVTTLFYCGCNCCCATVKTITGDRLAVMMTEGRYTRS